MDTVEQYIYRLPDNELYITAKLREWILAFHPRITEKLRYGIPYFDYYGWICYLNPLKKGGVDLCFTDGAQMEKTEALLELRNNKTTASIHLKSKNDLDYSIFKRLMQEAIQIRNAVRRKK